MKTIYYISIIALRIFYVLASVGVAGLLVLAFTFSCATCINTHAWWEYALVSFGAVLAIYLLYILYHFLHVVLIKMFTNYEVDAKVAPINIRARLKFDIRNTDYWIFNFMRLEIILLIGFVIVLTIGELFT